MIPDPPELVVLLIICTAITGLLKLETLGEWVWQIRCAVSPSLDRPSESTTTSDPTKSPAEGSPPNDHEAS